MAASRNPRQHGSALRDVRLSIVTLLLAVATRADVITLKDGRTITGKIVERADGRIVIQITDSIRMSVHETEVKSVKKAEYTVPTTKRPAPRPEPVTAKVCFLQVFGPIEADLTPIGIRRAIVDARRRGAELLVVELDTPGGRVDLTQQICELVERCGIDTVAFVCGGQYRGAFSAGVIIALSCERIYMAPGTSIGAATPYVCGDKGAPQVTEKMISAFAAVARATATRHGHSPHLAAAMVDPDVALREVKINGKRSVLPADQALEPARQGFEVGSYVSRKGKLLTLTAEEAHRLGLVDGLVSTRKELLKALGIDKPKVRDSRTNEEIAEALRRRERYILKLQGSIATQLSRAESLEPSRFTYEVYAAGEFVDGGREWRARSDACVRAYDICLNLCRNLLKVARKYPDLGFDQHKLMELMVDIKRRRDRVAADKARRGPPCY